ncbi:MAG TPA: tetratricopeptide repeat protein, partial [Nannocystaceae bacterium]|nr:tetratricopeptide repeat protein [Nannocystaceae bacterium]
GAIVAAAIGPWAIEAIGRQRAAQRCEDDANAGEWSSITPVHMAFGATGLDYAEDTWTRVEPVLAAYPQRWRDAFVQACLAEQHDRSCFEHRRGSYASLVDTLAIADADTLRNAVRAVHDLPALEPCADDAWLRQHPAPTDAEQAARVLELRGELARASWTRLAREPEATATTMLALHDRAVAIGWDPLLAEVELELGAAEGDRGDAAQAELTLTSAYRRAGAAGLDLVAADAAIGLVTLVGSELARPEAATIWATNAQMLLDRQGDAGRRRGQLAGAMVGVHRRTGDLAGARAAAEESLAAYRSAADATELAVLGALGNLAVLAIDTGELARGAELLEETLVAKERILGPNHPGVMGTLINLGALALQRGAYAEALAYDERALGLAQRLGDQHPDTLGILGNLSLIQLRLGDRERALALAQKVVDGRTALLGRLHPDTITAVNNVAAVQIERGEYAEAAAAFDDVLARQREREQTAPLELARTLFNLGAVRVKLGKPERARFDEAIAIYERELPRDHPELEKARE